MKEVGQMKKKVLIVLVSLTVVGAAVAILVHHTR